MKKMKSMKNKITSIKAIMSILSVMVLALFIAACDESSSGTSSAMFIGGLDSVSLDFDASSFPAEVFDNKQTPFTIAIKVENKGEYLVPKEKIKVSLDGFDPVEFGKTSADMKKNPSEDLIARKLEATTGKALPGTQTYVEFGEFDYQSKVIGQTERPVIATICFDYATAAQASICVNEKPFETLEKNPICEVKGIKTVAVSSGPVQITNFQETPTGASKVQFTFDVEHKGDGSVYKQSMDCATREENKVWISIDTGDMTNDLACTGIQGGPREGYITLYDGKKSITCTQSIGTKTGTFEKAATIELQYGYKKIKSAQLVIKPSEQS